MYSKICVAVRKRPLNQRESSNGDSDVIICTDRKNLTICEPKVKYDLTKFVEKHNYVFDEVLGEDCNNRTVYERTAKPLVETACNGGTATCFAYGQTGSGKTHTMLGNPNDPGLFYLAAVDLFSSLQKHRLSFEVRVSFFELYAGKLFDLLNNRKRLVAREDADQKVNICGLSEHVVKNERQLMEIIQCGTGYRISGVTSANDASSRSHAVFQIDLKTNGKNHGRLCFVDLAGNERGADTANCDRHTRMEGAEINKSLLALKECIRALGMGKSHIPFRGSVLTEVLKDCFSGANCRSVMIANVTPSSLNCEHTLNTLRYSDRVKEIRKASNALVGSPSGGNIQTPKRKVGGKMPPKPEWKGVLEEDVQAILQNHRKDLDDNEEIMIEMDGSEEAEAVHTHLVNSLRRQESEIIAFHREHIDKKMELVRVEVTSMMQMDVPRPNLEEYVSRVDASLVKQLQSITELRQKLQRIQLQLREEEVLSKTFTPHFYA